MGCLKNKTGGSRWESRKGPERGREAGVPGARGTREQRRKVENSLAQCQNHIRSQGYAAKFFFFLNSGCWSKTPGTSWDGINRSSGNRKISVFSLLSTYKWVSHCSSAKEGASISS